MLCNFEIYKGIYAFSEGFARKNSELYKLVAELESLFPGRHFTLDGHLVGSIGEVLAAYHYDLELLPASVETHDALSASGVRVQIKATQVGHIGIRAEPEHLLVLGLDKAGQHYEIYNGPGKLAWNAAGMMQKNGQRRIGRNKLISLMKQVPDTSKLPKVQ